MKYFFIFIINLYKKIISPHLPPACRHYPSCSQYSIRAFERHGAAKGLYLSAERLLRCNPFGSSGYDPVPVRFKWKHAFRLAELKEEEKRERDENDNEIKPQVGA